MLFVFLKSMIRLMQTDAEFRELFEQLSSETKIDEHIDFDFMQMKLKIKKESDIRSFFRS